MRGAKLGEIPVEQPTKFDLVVTLITAQALGRRGVRVRWRREFVGLVAVQPLRKPAIGWANQRS